MPDAIEVVAIADDTTGALEVGAQFSAAGVRTAVLLDVTASWPLRSACVLDAQTRHLAPAEASRRMRELALAARDLALAGIYLKTDSTLRGNIPEEFEALLSVYADRPLVYAPAYPEMGRTVRNGRLYVDGVPLRDTDFARDPLSPAQEGDIPALLAKRCALRVLRATGAAGLASQLGPGTVVVCDGESEDDLAALAAALGVVGRHIAAGPGGFAGHWIRHLPVARGEPPPRPRIRRPLVVNGSLHPVSREQIRRAQSLGHGFDAWIVLTAPEALAGDPRAVARQLAGAALHWLEQGSIDGLIIFGGDTAAAVLKVARCTLVEPCGNLLPGIPLSKFQFAGREFGLVTKAGGFGPPDVLERICRRLVES